MENLFSSQPRQGDLQLRPLEDTTVHPNRDTIQTLACASGDAAHAGVDSFYLMRQVDSRDMRDASIHRTATADKEMKRFDSLYGIQLVEADDDCDVDAQTVQSTQTTNTQKSVFQSIYDGWFGHHDLEGPDMTVQKKKQHSAMQLQSLTEKRKALPANVEKVSAKQHQEQEMINSFFSAKMGGSSDSQLGPNEPPLTATTIDADYGVQMVEDTGDDDSFTDSLPASLHGPNSGSVNKTVDRSLVPSDSYYNTHNKSNGGLLESVLSWFALPGTDNTKKTKSALKLEALAHTPSMDQDPFYNSNYNVKSANSSLYVTKEATSNNRSFRDAVDMTTAEPLDHHRGGAMAMASFYSLQGDVDSFDETSLHEKQLHKN